MGPVKNKVMPKSASTTKLGDYGDLKKKTEFSAMTIDGVHKETTYVSRFSTFHSSPKYSMAPRGTSSFIRSGSSPAPGTYNLPDDGKSKFKDPPKFSFGGGSRFGLGASPTKKAPGPGAYNPHDPVLHTDVKVGFGTSIRGR